MALIQPNIETGSTINGVNVTKTINTSPQANTTGALTAAQPTAGTTVAGGTVTVTDLMGVGSANIQISGTYTGVNLTFELSIDGGTTWQTTNVQSINTGQNTVSGATGVLGSGASLAWNATFLGGVDRFRVRASAYSTGAANIVIHPSAQFANNYVSVMAAPTTQVTKSGTWSMDSLTPGTAAVNLGKAEDAAHASGDTGVFMLAVRNDNAATAQTSATNDYSSIGVDINGTQFTRDAPSNTATKSNVAAAITSTTILAANAARRTAIIYNDSASDLYLSYGGTASSTSFTVYVPSLATVSIQGSEYAGALVGIWISATGNARVTEVTI